MLEMVYLMKIDIILASYSDSGSSSPASRRSISLIMIYENQKHIHLVGKRFKEQVLIENICG